MLECHQFVFTTFGSKLAGVNLDCRWNNHLNKHYISSSKLEFLISNTKSYFFRDFNKFLGSFTKHQNYLNFGKRKTLYIDGNIESVLYVCIWHILINNSPIRTWDHINRFKPVTRLCLSQARTWISNVICRVLSCFQWVKVKGVCSFCWYWWNCWPLLFKLSFHNSRDQNLFQIL